MKVNLIRIGNSKGVRIPSSVIKECGFGEQIEMRVEQGVIVLSPLRGVREGWDAAFEKMAATGDDAALISDALETDFDNEEWTW
jgi:antitoxin MazE